MTEDKKSRREKKANPTKKSKDKAADAKSGKKPKKEELTLAQRSERLRAKLSPEKNFRLLKILIIVLSVICAAISAYVYIFVIYDKTTPFSIAKNRAVNPCSSRNFCCFSSRYSRQARQREDLSAPR
ncbi:MAG: hypothetical protein L6V85_04885 [Clostridiales bacterium]|nr:MAG: hypothetical protein L6V85_04885 [Clostridiales bacterium]